MPKLSVWMVRAALIHMGVGFLFGAMILWHKGVPLFDWTWKLLNPHIELMIFGWTMQIVMGTAYWILPRFSGPDRYGRTRLGWWSFGLFNAALLMTAGGAWLTLEWMLLAGRLAMLAAVVLFIVLIYPRVKPLGGYAASQSS